MQAGLTGVTSLTPIDTNTPSRRAAAGRRRAIVANGPERSRRKMDEADAGVMPAPMRRPRSDVLSTHRFKPDMHSSKASGQFELQAALNEVGMAPSAHSALQAYRRNSDLLADWRVIYADTEDRSNLKLRRQQLSETGFVATVFRGKSLWVFDREAIATDALVHFGIGHGTFVDSNAASYIRSLAYREQPRDALLQWCRALSATIPADELARLNPYLYLWENRNDRSAKRVARVRESIAAIHALSLIREPLDANWGIRYRTSCREAAEAAADQLLAGFYRDLESGLADAIDSQVDLMEAVLVRTKIIELASGKSPGHKLEELVRFMHDDLSTFMLRELLVCADILSRGGRCQLSDKLNALQNQAEPLALLRNAAWDLAMPRFMEDMTNTLSGPEQSAFYVPNLITFDRDVVDILNLTALRAIALPRTSHEAFPFFDEPLHEWLGERVGDRRMSGLAPLFGEAAFDARARRRSRSHMRDVLREDRQRLLSLLAQAKR